MSLRTNDDFLTATGYIHRKLVSPDWPDQTFHATAKQLFPTSTELDKSTLNDWCAQWLSDNQSQKLAAAIRSARKRGRNPDTKTVTSTASAHGKLARIARWDAVTLSEAVERSMK